MRFSGEKKITLLHECWHAGSIIIIVGVLKKGIYLFCSIFHSLLFFYYEIIAGIGNKQRLLNRESFYQPHNSQRLNVIFIRFSLNYILPNDRLDIV